MFLSCILARQTSQLDVLRITKIIPDGGTNRMLALRLQILIDRNLSNSAVWEAEHHGLYAGVVQEGLDGRAEFQDELP